MGREVGWKNIEKHKFKKGNPGGPGRPKGKSMVDTMREVLERRYNVENKDSKEIENLSGREIITLKLMEKAMKGDLKAIAEVFDRLDGKPAQTIKSASFNLDLDAESIRNMSDEELDEVEKQIIKSINGES